MHTTEGGSYHPSFLSVNSDNYSNYWLGVNVHWHNGDTNVAEVSKQFLIPIKGVSSR